MALPVIANTIRTSIEGHGANGHKWAMVWHHRKDGALSFGAAITILDPFVVQFFNVVLGGGDKYLNFMPTTAGLDQVRYTPLDATTATTVISHALVGLNAGEPLPASVCLVATFRTGNRGRSFRGRTYTPTHTEAGNTPPGVPTAGLVAALATQFAGYKALLVGSGLSLVVASYKLALATDVATITVDSRWDTQRRRLNT